MLYYLYALFFFLFVVLLLSLSFSRIKKFLRKFSAKTKTELDDIILEKIEKPTKIFIFFFSAYLSIYFFFSGVYLFGHELSSIFFWLLFVSLAYLVAEVVDSFLAWYGKEIAPKTKTTLDDELLPAIRKIAKFTIFFIFLLIALQELGIEILPLLAGLGIGGLAVALALQDTLENFFAGLHIFADRPLKINDYILLQELGIEGRVVEIGWRSTRLLAPGNKLIVVPNSKIARSTIVNVDSPDKPIWLVLGIGVSYDSDIKKVKKVIMKVLEEVRKKNEWVAKEYAPWVRMDKFSDFSIDFKFGICVKDYTKRFNVLDDVYTRLFYEFKKSKISIPFPTHTVYLKRGKR